MTKFTLQNYCCRLIATGIFVLFFHASNFAQIVPGASGIVYVNKNVVGGTQNGSSWANAVTELADALKFAYTHPTVQQIWVARGNYQPLYSAGTDNMNPYLQFGNPGSKFNSFLMVNNVKLYGGFQNANETSITERDTMNNNTILNGDNYSLHVVMSVGNVGSAEINGFTITGGKDTATQLLYVNSMATYSTRGGGVYIANSAPIIANCVIRENRSEEGAGVYAINSAVKIYRSKIVQNSAVGHTTGQVQSAPVARGGGIGAFNCHLMDIVDCNVDSNSSVTILNRALGGGIWAHNIVSNMVINIQNTSINHNNTSSNTSPTTNTATGYGGGLYAAIENNIGTLNINNSSIDHNTLSVQSGGRVHSFGGGLNTNCSLNLNNSSIKFNSNTSTGPYLTENEFCRGGGIYYSGRSGNIKNSIIEGNSIEGDIEPSGGGIYNENLNFHGSNLIVSNSKITNNTAGAYGGGIYNNDSESAKLYNTLIANNSAAKGGAVCNDDGYYFEGKLTLINCTLVDNLAHESGNYDAVYNRGDNSKTFVHNSILWVNKVNDLVDMSTAATYSIVQGNTVISGIGNLNTDPQFVNAAADDFRIQATSPAANAGSNASYATVGNINNDTDLSGQPRLYENTIDMGAYELQSRSIDTSTNLVALIQRNSRFKIHPNPVTAATELTIISDYTAAELTGSELRLTDIAGREWQRVNYQFPIHKLIMPSTSGTYFVTIAIRNGSQTTIPITVK